MRVMTFNLRGALSWDGPNLWPLRRDLVRELLQGARPTLVGLQEVWAPVEPYLSRALPGHAVVRGHGTGMALLPVRNPVYYERDRLRLLNEGAIWLGPSSLRSRRAATWLRLLDGDRELLVLNTHLDHRSAEARALAVDRILVELGLLGWPRLPAILCGDFNENGGGALHRRLLAAGFVDCFLEAGQRDDEAVYTFHGYTGRKVGDEGRIDWILRSGPLRTRRAEILREARPPRYPSDHYPVLVELDWDDIASAVSRG